MSFHEIRLPTDISFGSSGGPQFSTNIITSQNGFEQRNVNWSLARGRYDIIHAIKDQPQITVLLEFFRARQGRAHAFRFKDWADYSVNSQEIGIGDDSETDFQLIKSYISGNTQIDREIKKPVENSIKIYFDGIEQISDWSVDATTGIVSFITAPANGVAIIADFEFDVPVRFDTDFLKSEFDTYGVSSIREIPLIEVRV